MDTRPAGVGPPLLLLGGTVNALSVARSMAGDGIAVHALADGLSPSLVRHSRSLRGFQDVSSAASAQEEWLEWLPSGPRGAVVLPCGDPGAELVARHRAFLVELGYVPVEANDDLVLALLDKERTCALARSAGIAVPRTAAGHTAEELIEGSRQFQFPCAVKPVCSHRSVHRIGAKAVVARTFGELKQAISRLMDMDIEILVTEIVPGPDDGYCSLYSYVTPDGQPLVCFTKRKLRQYPVGFGWGCLHEVAWEPDAAELGMRFFAQVGLCGIGVVEFKRSSRDGALTLIECNPRLTAATSLVRAAGLDLARLAYDRALGRPGARPHGYRNGRREWHPLPDTRAALELWRADELSVGRWVRTVAPPVHLPIWDPRDPGPSLHHGRARLGSAVARAQRSWHDRTRSPSQVTRALCALARSGRVGTELAWHAERLRVGITAGGLARAGPRQRPEDLAHRWDSFHRQIWEEAAGHLGATLQDLGSGFLAIERGPHQTVVWQYQVMLDDPVTLDMALDKTLTYRRLASAGIPVPRHREFDADDPGAASRFLQHASRPCVVKPATGTAGGHGVTCGVTDGDALLRACLRARRWGRRLMIEEHVEGTEYRLLFLDGSLIGAVRRAGPAVVGDGRSSVAALIRAENARRRADGRQNGLRTIDVDLDCLLALRASGMSLSTVPAAGAVVTVKSAANANGPRDNVTVSDLGADVVRSATQAVRAVGLRLAGVDLITPDPRVGLACAGGAVIEMNGTPGLHYHYLVADRAQAVRVAVPILARLLDPGSQAIAAMTASAASSVPATGAPAGATS